MLELNDGGARCVRSLIERYGVHDEGAILPVPIKQIAREEGWQVEYHDRMGGAVAMAFLVGPVKLMYINANLTLRAQRIGIAHELGHVLAGHHLHMDTYMSAGHTGGGLLSVSERQEDEAHLVAAMLLIPERLRDGAYPAQVVARRCGVTAQLVTRYRHECCPMLELGVA